MMKSCRLRAALWAAAIVGISGMAAAQDTDRGGRWYAQIGGGPGWVLELDWTRTDVLGATTVSRATTSFDTGWIVGGAVGYEVSKTVRLELEGAYRSNGLSNLVTNTAGGASGDVTTAGIVVNALYDLDTGSPVTPYIGPGIGLANVKTSWTTGGARFEDDGWGLALQAIVGVSYAFSPSIQMFGQYQAFMVPHTPIRSAAPVAGGTTTFKLEDTYISHSFFFGLRYAF